MLALSSPSGKQMVGFQRDLRWKRESDTPVMAVDNDLDLSGLPLT